MSPPAPDTSRPHDDECLRAAIAQSHLAVENGNVFTYGKEEKKERGQEKKKDSDAANQATETERSLLSSELGAAAATRDMIVPTINLSEGTDHAISRQLWEAANTVGFFTIVGHGIPQSTIDDAFAVSASFFADHSQEEKSSMSAFASHLNSGYEYMAQVRPSTGTADQKESLHITAREGCMDGRWPDDPPNFRDATETLITEAHALSCRLLTLLEPLACPQLEPGTLAKAHELWGHDGQCILRMLHYFPMSIDTARTLTTSDANTGKVHWRCGPHTDWSNLSLLFQQVGQVGLECCSNPRDATKSDRNWTPIDPVEGGIAVNIGDMLALWSDGRLYSNLHRVRMPTEKECTPPSSRYSIGFFLQADRSTLIESSDSEPTTAGEYILSRIRSNFAK